MARIACAALALILVLSAAVAQESGDGQFCVRGFEDRNANLTRDAGEPLLTSGMAADLLDESGIVVASALLAESPTAAQGVICFQFLPPGQYSIQVTAAEYVATTPDTMTVTLRGGELPAVLEFGAQSIVDAQPQPTEATAQESPQWPRFLTAAIGALIALVVMQAIGLVVYLLRFRRRKPVKPSVTQTGQFKRPLT
ncbi:MAG: hypothetical protein IPM16_04490 [Chloroflexi bacterium]|nr:hypothetical protein [Chloroflexota bacterium]